MKQYTREIGLGTNSPDSSLLKLTYDYGNTANNGNVLSQRIVIPGSLDVTQSYGYDSLNRLSTASETNNLTPGTNWTQTYDYDRYGNRAVRVGSYMPQPLSTPQSASATDLSAFSASTNRIVLAGYGYDTSGNLTSDPSTQANAMIYDSENHMISYMKSGVTATYIYDGEGRRVKKTDNGGTTVFVYNAARQMIAEYRSDPAPPPSGGGGTSYLTTDHLGSTRIVTKSDGSIKARYDYLPFGEELPNTIGTRSTGLGYGGSDRTRQKFTQKERDSESGLDYFLARYYSSAQGRFTSPDEFRGGPDEFWVLGSGDPEKQAIAYADVTNPQSLNKYHYGYNNPLRYVDPDGHQERAGQMLDQDVKDYLAGRITKEQYMARINARGVGALIGVAAVATPALGARAAQSILLWAAANPDKVQQIGEDLVELSSGNPVGKLTISAGTRLTEAEISTGVRLAEQAGTHLVQSEHIGAEFIDAAGKTYDAMGGAKAFEHFGSGKQFLESIVHHVNKSVDHVAIDLKGASEAQVKAIKEFVGSLTKEQQGKIIYVQ